MIGSSFRKKCIIVVSSIFRVVSLGLARMVVSNGKWHDILKYNFAALSFFNIFSILFSKKKWVVRIVTLYTSILSVFLFGIWLSAVEILPNVNGDWQNFRAPGYVSFVNMASLTTFDPTVYIINVREHQRGDKKKKGQSRETGNIGYTGRRQTKQEKTPLYANKHK